MPQFKREGGGHGCGALPARAGPLAGCAGDRLETFIQVPGFPAEYRTDMASTLTQGESAQLAQTIEMFEVITESQPHDYQSLEILKEAYFKLGDLYYFQLDEKENALNSYTKLLTRFPGSDHEPEVLYKMYLISRERGTNDVQYATALKEKYPNSTYARILVNPDYLKESSIAAEKQKLCHPPVTDM